MPRFVCWHCQRSLRTTRPPMPRRQQQHLKNRPWRAPREKRARSSLSRSEDRHPLEIRERFGRSLSAEARLSFFRATFQPRIDAQEAAGAKSVGPQSALRASNLARALTANPPPVAFRSPISGGSHWVSRGKEEPRIVVACRRTSSRPHAIRDAGSRRSPIAPSSTAHSRNPPSIGPARLARSRSGPSSCGLVEAGTVARIHLREPTGPDGVG